MKINEFTAQPENKLNFDVVDDAIVFMRNDPTFYRKKYFPAMASMADLIRNNKEIDRDAISSMVDSGMNTYCKKYNLGRGPADIFTMEDREAIIEKICSEELEQINNGAY